MMAMMVTEWNGHWGMSSRTQGAVAVQRGALLSEDDKVDDFNKSGNDDDDSRNTGDQLCYTVVLFTALELTKAIKFPVVIPLLSPSKNVYFGCEIDVIKQL
ncbi:unnamed protein product [Enterobius vermicularis]|uniref:Secreted protein n=1 Tax=Enterobius vermicularis TaxID=51028 RepID=A0A0N4VDA9_ENTVE|nr:unnamed protein product [Enterobius vermicularis]